MAVFLWLIKGFIQGDEREWYSEEGKSRVKIEQGTSLARGPN